MASRVEFAVSATPIYTHAAGEGAASDVIAADVGKTVGGSGNVTVTWGSTVGYAAGVPTYLDGGIGSLAATIQNIKCIYFKHTGFERAGANTLGAATAITWVLSAGGIVIAELGAGQSIFLPFATAQSPAFTWISGDSGSTSIAIEYFATV